MRLWERGAAELQRLITRREVSAVEVVTAFLERIGAVNGRVNAIVTLLPERALADAAAADRVRTPRGPLHGLPIAIKDLVDTAGMRTTYGSPLYADHVPDVDAWVVRRLRDAGAIVVGKTNTPEFGAGSQTFNPVFGVTRNPYDLSRTAGGSSGGAAAAVAAGMLPFADGSDLGGSLRNPASFCNVVGLRPTPGRVPVPEREDLWDPLSVVGPIARSVADAALLLGALAEPLSVPLALGAWTPPDPEADLRGKRIAWSRDLGGLPVDPAVADALEQARPVFAELGCDVVDAEPELAEADEVFHVLRALAFLRQHGDDVRVHRDAVKETVVWNVEEGLALDPDRIVRAQSIRSELFRRTAAFLERYDALALPASLVPPFPAEQEWVDEIAGVRLETYLDWMRACTRISVTAHPAVSVPFAFTADGLPVGLQLVGRYGDERGLLELAAGVEAAAGASRRRPQLT